MKVTNDLLGKQIIKSNLGNDNEIEIKGNAFFKGPTIKILIAYLKYI